MCPLRKSKAPPLVAVDPSLSEDGQRLEGYTTRKRPSKSSKGRNARMVFMARTAVGSLLRRGSDTGVLLYYVGPPVTPAFD